ncbi:hypothetical protein [Hasllibacter sp. MH4015]|uniref:hypothetical protein n=1 Tax=Hasllibacter sp. MH4015 TaxID=2854029 RepID=UPI001CD3305E|nr:hypothetical protein [Hasllibacter sp. MH4015]
MMMRLLLTGFLAACLTLTGLSAVVAQTRMAASGGYCGTDAPQILLDAAGLPVLDAGGETITAPDCPLCHLPVVLSAPGTAPSAPPETLIGAAPAPATTDLAPRAVRLTAQARAPPRA